MKIEVFEEGLEVESIEIVDVKRKIEEVVDKFINNLRQKGIALNASEAIEYVAESVDEMEEEAPDWVKIAAVSNEAMKAYSITKPFEVIFGWKTVCSGASVTCSDGVKVTYSMDRAPARSPDDFKRRYGHYPRIWMEEYKGGTLIKKEVVLKQDRIGRAKDPIFGWDKYKKLVAGALCSFRHNFEESLFAFARTGKAPLKKVWVLPNIIPDVNKIEIRKWRARIMQPPCFCPPAVIRYRTKFPWLARVKVRIGFFNPSNKSVKVGIEVWRHDKSDRARISGIEIPPGNSELDVLLKCSPLSIGQRLDISNGYVAVDPYEAYKGVSVTYAVTEPRSVYSVKEDMYGGLII